MRNKNHAFTLLELTIVLTIISVVLGAGISHMLKRSERQAVKITHERMQLLVQAIDDYVDHHGRIPCPANPQAAWSDADFGFESESGGNCDATNIAGSASIPTGTVPVHTLAVPPIWGIDGWNNRITYVVDEELVVTGDGTTPFNGSAGTGYTASDAAGIIDIEMNNAISSVRSDAAVVLISHGLNRYGAWSMAGGPRYSPTGGSDNEDENTDADDTFKLFGVHPSSDDITYFLTKWQIDGEWRE